MRVANVTRRLLVGTVLPFNKRPINYTSKNMN